MRRPNCPALLASLCLLAGPFVALPAAAEVVDAAAGGFTSRNSVTVAAAPAEVWDALVEIGAWWSSSHSYSGDAANMTLEPRPQGCFCEALPDGGGVRHLEVVAVMPGRLLRMSGGLGPLQGMGLGGALSWELAPQGEATTLSATYVVHGYAAGGLEGLAAVVDRVVGEQVGRLGRYVETGSPEPAPPPEGEVEPTPAAANAVTGAGDQAGAEGQTGAGGQTGAVDQAGAEYQGGAGDETEAGPG